MGDPFAHVQLIDGQGSRAKIRRGQVVKAFFQRSKILTRVAALDTVPMGVTPLACMTCSSAARSAALIRSLHVILNHFLGVPRACMLTDQVLALHVVCALLCSDDDMYYCHITTRTSTRPFLTCKGASPPVLVTLE